MACPHLWDLYFVLLHKLKYYQVLVVDLVCIYNELVKHENYYISNLYILYILNLIEAVNTQLISNSPQYMKSQS